jgi:hypothetical protein
MWLLAASRPSFRGRFRISKFWGDFWVRPGLRDILGDPPKSFAELLQSFFKFRFLSFDPRG